MELSAANILKASAQKLQSKYWGVDNLHENEEFWNDVLMAFCGTEQAIVMPLEFTKANRERLLAMVDCPPGKCGLCCHYTQTTVSHEDVSRMLAGGVPNLTENIKGLDSPKPYIDSSKGCPYLVDNACSIYEHRPEICRVFPLQGGVMAMWDGQQYLSCVVRLKCPSAFTILKTVMQEQIPTKDWRLMPDLGVLPKWKEGGPTQ